MSHRLERCQFIATVSADWIATERRLAAQLLAIDAVHEDARHFDGRLAIINVRCTRDLLILAALQLRLIRLPDVTPRHPML